jgi:hypothetical protein
VSSLSGDSAPSANHTQPRVFSGGSTLAARLHVSSRERQAALRVKSLAPHPLASPRRYSSSLGGDISLVDTSI